MTVSNCHMTLLTVPYHDCGPQELWTQEPTFIAMNIGDVNIYQRQNSWWTQQTIPACITRNMHTRTQFLCWCSNTCKWVNSWGGQMLCQALSKPWYISCERNYCPCLVHFWYLTLPHQSANSLGSVFDFVTKTFFLNF